jgi:hypothetical protein
MDGLRDDGDLDLDTVRHGGKSPVPYSFVS